MRVLMLGWEFPPFISGGLGTACHGLTRALGRQGVEVVFVLPKAVSPNTPSHVKLLPRATANGTLASHAADLPSLNDVLSSQEYAPGKSLEHVTFRVVPSAVANPYQAAAAEQDVTPQQKRVQRARLMELIGEGRLGPGLSARAAFAASRFDPGQNPMYAGDMLVESKRYADLCVRIALRETFDVIHAHDWMSFPAGLAVAAVTGKPFIAHVHSTEYDRSGVHINQPIYDLERRGVHGALRVIAVSHLTKSILQHRYHLDPEKIEVVYNGIETDGGVPTLRSLGRGMIRKGDKIVLFLGRITLQKGPEYFVAAARKVLEKIEHVKFVMAGSGDKIREVMDLAEQQGIGSKIIFTGFLRGKDVERVFRAADVYVMPSVSEPFGIAPLEAISHDVPVILSKQSGVSEVLTHVLKVDFWDVEDIANKIIAVLKHPPLSSTLREHADIELRKLTWDDAAGKCVNVYHDALKLIPL